MHLSIRSKLTIAFFLVLLPFLLLEFFSVRERTASGKQAVVDSLTGSAQTAAATMDAFMAEIIRKEQSAAQLVTAERALSPEELNVALAQVRAPGAGATVRVLPVPVVIPKLETLSRSLQPFAVYLAYVDSKGRVVAADPPTLVGQDMSANPEAQPVLQLGQVWADSGYRSDLPGTRAVGGFAVCLGLRTAAPGGAICAGIEAGTLRDVLPTIPPGDLMVILDSRGQALFTSKTLTLSTEQRDWSRLPFVTGTTGSQSTSAEFVSPLDGQGYIGAQTRVSSLDWLMGVYRPRQAALAPVEAATQREIIVFGLIVVMTLALSQILGTVLVRPILDLTAHARQLSRGDLKRRISIVTGDETQTLAETFNSMSQSLDRTISDLMQAQQEIARQSEQLQQLLVRTNAVQEDERRRIAFDIHDGVIQLVVAAGYELQAAGRHVGNGNSDEARRKLERARQLMDQTVVEMRRIVFDLHPTSLDSRGLTPSLEKYAASWQESTNIACSFAVEGDPVDLSPEVKVGVYRIVQEALTNIRKHACATHVSMQATFTGDRLRLIIEDDGSGFSLDDVRAANGGASGHLGLMSMSERARTLGGQIDIRSQPGQGTRLVLDIPIS
jgi:signal transduction histidine kinase